MLKNHCLSKNPIVNLMLGKKKTTTSIKSRHSVKFYRKVRTKNNHKIVIPTSHDKFIEFFKGNDDGSYLSFVYKNGSQGV